MANNLRITDPERVAPCVECGKADYRVLDTRPAPPYLKRRRYQCNNCSARFSSIEIRVPETQVGDSLEETIRDTFLARTSSARLLQELKWRGWNINVTPPHVQLAPTRSEPENPIQDLLAAPATSRLKEDRPPVPQGPARLSNAILRSSPKPDWAKPPIDPPFAVPPVKEAHDPQVAAARRARQTIEDINLARGLQLKEVWDE